MSMETLSMSKLMKLSTALIALLLFGCDRSAPASPARPAQSRVAAGGLVEPAGEERVVIPTVSGRLIRVAIDEGDSVKRGQVLAEIDNAEQIASIAAADAQIALRESELLRLRNGARREDIAQAQAALEASQARERIATSELKRRESIADRKLLSMEQLEQSRAQFAVAKADRLASDAALTLLRNGARSEDLTSAEAAVAAAKAEKDRAEAAYEKTLIRSPIDGVVLKRDLREGETLVALSPLPLARIGDISHLFVRADIDELDIGHVKEGQPAKVTSDAFPDQVFEGTVRHVSRRMGRRNLVSDNPAQKQDTKVLETLIELSGQPQLPVGLRVDVVIDITPQSSP
ncbi:MAG: efflux RND transporter periplasmic adaptor subunit [Dokdonella sp.]